VHKSRSGILVSSDAIGGPVLPTVAAVVRPVGALRFSHITFDHLAMPGNASKIVVELSPYMDISKGDTITLVLPDFTFKVPTAPVTVNWYYRAQQDGVFALGVGDPTSQATWSGSELRTFVSHAVPENTQVRIEIDKLAGAVIPFLGVRTNDTRIKIATNASGGPMPVTLLTSVQPVGSFGNSPRLRYSVEGTGIGRVDAVASILLSFTAEMRLFPGDTVVLNLPTFTAAADRTLNPQAQNLGGSGAVTASWKAATEQLSFTINTEVEARHAALILVPTEMGIILPAGGLRENQENLKISTNAARGPMPALRIASTPAVGAFDRAEFESFPECQVFRRAEHIIKFQLTAVVSAGETVTVNMFDFELSPGASAGNTNNAGTFVWRFAN
jgi:hypothetical protein